MNDKTKNDLGAQGATAVDAACPSVPTPKLPHDATLHTEGWGGRQQQPCIVVGETPQRYRVRARPGEYLRLPRGRHQSVLQVHAPGTYLVPKRAITFEVGSDD